MVWLDCASKYYVTCLCSFWCSIASVCTFYCNKHRCNRHQCGNPFNYPFNISLVWIPKYLLYPIYNLPRIHQRCWYHWCKTGRCWARASRHFARLYGSSGGGQWITWDGVHQRGRSRSGRGNTTTTEGHQTVTTELHRGTVGGNIWGLVECVLNTPLL